MAGQLGLCEHLPWLTSIMSGLHNRGPVAGLASETGVLHESAVHVRKTVDPVARAYNSPILLSQFANSASSNPNSCTHTHRSFLTPLWQWIEVWRARKFVCREWHGNFG